MISVQNFINEFKNEKIQNTKTSPNAVSEYLKAKLAIKTYIPFRTKREIVEMVVDKNMKVIDGIKKYDDIDSYVSFVVAMLSTHTALEFSEDPVADYDLLAESGLLPDIMAEFKTDYDECSALLKMTIAAELEDNNFNVIVGKFLDGLIKNLGGIADIIKGLINNTDFKEEDLAKLKSFLDKK